MPSTGRSRTPARRTQAERSASTIRRILDAAATCLMRLGYAGTSTIEVAAEAGVSQGAVFRHFATRLDLMTALATDLTDSLVARLSETFAEFDPSVDNQRQLLSELRQLSSDRQMLALYELVDGSRSEPELAEQVIVVWQVLHARIVNAAARLEWPVGTDRAQVDAFVFVLMRVWEAETRFRAVVGDGFLELNVASDRLSELLYSILGGELSIDWDEEMDAESD